MGFAQAGARVGLLARNQAELDVAKMEIEHAGGHALRLRADVCDLEQMTAAVDRMLAVFGSLDVLVAAAGVARLVIDNERAVFDIPALLDATLEFQPPAGQA